VSVESISWALNLAPVPADRGGQPSSACKFVLVGLANHAGPDGTTPGAHRDPICTAGLVIAENPPAAQSGGDTRFGAVGGDDAP
jgi:hypothetical protein